jgi:hypothetical protein
MSTAAHLVGTLLVGAGLPAQLRDRFVLSRFLVLFGVAVAHIPDLLTASSLP